MSKGKVLIVDDDPFVLKSVRATLEGAGYDVATYRSAITVPLELREQKPDLVLLDVTMPDLVAKDAVKAMKRLKIMEGVPIILFSSKDEKELEDAVEAAGAHGYIAKGLERDLVAGIERYWPRPRS
jgi:DNA-binding response OmpR family regulator